MIAGMVSMMGHDLAHHEVEQVDDVLVDDVLVGDQGADVLNRYFDSVEFDWVGPVDHDACITENGSLEEMHDPDWLMPDQQEWAATPPEFSSAMAASSIWGEDDELSAIARSVCARACRMHMSHPCPYRC